MHGPLSFRFPPPPTPPFPPSPAPLSSRPARAIQVSQLLERNEEVSSIMRSGGLVSDAMVLQLVVEVRGGDTGRGRGV